MDHKTQLLGKYTWPTTCHSNIKLYLCYAQYVFCRAVSHVSDIHTHDMVLNTSARLGRAYSMELRVCNASSLSLIACICVGRGERERSWAGRQQSLLSNKSGLNFTQGKLLLGNLSVCVGRESLPGVSKRSQSG